MRAADFDRLYAEHAQSLFGFLVYRLGDRALAEDHLADTFERALRSRDRFDRRRGSEKSWLYAIALNLMRDHQRRRSTEERALRRADAGGERSGTDPALELAEHRSQLGPALALLSGEEREAIALRFGADMTAPEMAKLLREPLSTVEGRVYRALRKLRKELGQHGQ